MRRSFLRIKGMGYILWHGKHEVVHILLALLWAWFLRELWSEFNLHWVIAAMFGGLLPDVDHVLYYVTNRKRDPYAKMVMAFLKDHQWRVLAKFIESTHKYNTNLSFHNIYIALLLFCFCAASYVYDWRMGVVLFGAMVTHYLYDIVDDFLILGYMNPNWKRLGRAKSQKASARAVDNLS